MTPLTTPLFLKLPTRLNSKLADVPKFTDDTAQKSATLLVHIVYEHTHILDSDYDSMQKNPCVGLGCLLRSKFLMVAKVLIRICY